LEAAVYGIPVVFGPKYHKFKEAKDLIACGGGISVDNREGFVKCMDGFLANPDERAKAGRAAGSFVCDNAGATDRILSYLSKS
jgi:3-deoxy-D-manno-octulosonic-acid transferase